MTIKINAIDKGILVSALIFIIVLQVAAWFDRSIITLHIAETVPYIIGPILCLRREKFGYALTFASGTFWLWCGAFLTTFVRNGFEQLSIIIQTGVTDRPDILIAVPATLGTAGLMLFACVGYLKQSNKKWRDALLLLLAFAVITVFFLGIFKLFAPQYLGIFNGVFWG